MSKIIPCPHCGHIRLSPTARMVKEHHTAGLRNVEIAAALGISQPLVSYTLRTLSLPRNKKAPRHAPRS